VADAAVIVFSGALGLLLAATVIVGDEARNLATPRRELRVGIIEAVGGKGSIG
jgi:hypothetical protein